VTEANVGSGTWFGILIMTLDENLMKRLRLLLLGWNGNGEASTDRDANADADGEIS